MKKPVLYLMLILAYFPVRLLSQSKDLLPVSPEAAALTKMVDYPISMNTGIPDINVPFYEITVGDLRLPITLQYHAGGFRINEQATRAGLGWSLSSDLQITRTVNGLDDFQPGVGYISNPHMKTYYPNPSSCPGCDFPFGNSYQLYQFALGNMDGAPDRFSYRLLNKSGSFYFQKNNTGTSYTIVPVPYDNIKIQYVDGAFMITDVDGTVYYFGDQGTGTAQSKGIETSAIGGDVPVRSAWKCRRIAASNGTDEITFNYTAKAESKYRNYSDRIEFYNNPNPCGLGPDYYHTPSMPPMNNPAWTYEILMGMIPFFQVSSPKYMVSLAGSGTSYFHVPYLNTGNEVMDWVYKKTVYPHEEPISTVLGLSLTEINFRGGKVQFNGIGRLSSVRVLDHQNREVKTLNLFQSYASPNYADAAKLYNGLDFQGTMYLDSLHLQKGGEIFERYALFYTSKFCYGNHLKGQDAWGYPNTSTKDIYYANMFGENNSLPTINILQTRFYGEIFNSCSNFVTNIPLTIGHNDWAEATSEDDLKRGVLRRIVYPTGGFTDFDFEANRYTEEFYSPSSVGGQSLYSFLPQLSGGLRIKAINHYDIDGKHLSQKYYRYGMYEEGTGLLVHRPARAIENGRFHFSAVGYDQKVAYLRASDWPGESSPQMLSVIGVEDKTTYHTASGLNYTYADGAPIYYQKVTEYRQDQEETGKVVHEYYPPDYFYHPLDIPFWSSTRVLGTNIQYQLTSGLSGMQKSVTSYRANGVGVPGYTAVTKKEYEYYRYLRPEQIRVAYIYTQVLYSVVQGYYTGTMEDIYNTSFDSWFDQPPNYIFGQYGIASARVLPLKVTETNYEGLDSLQTVSTYSYANLPYLQPSSISTMDSKGMNVTRITRYAYNTSGAVYSTMVGANMLSQPVEEITYSEGSEVSRKMTNYATFSVGLGLIAPASIQQSVNGGALRTEMTFDVYDQYGNILQQTGLNGVPVSYLWGYWDRNPVAVLDGVKYSQIPSSYKNNSTLNNPADDSTLLGFLDGLRTGIVPSYRVRTYSYSPLVGMTRQVDADLRTSYYTYDGMGRLQTEKDNEGNILNHYGYRMKGPSAPWMATMLYANYPFMRTHSVEVSPGFRQNYNWVVPGGKYLTQYGQATVEGMSREEWYSPTSVLHPADVPPLPTTSMAAVRLYHYLGIGAYYGDPDKLWIDFIQDGAIVSSFPFTNSGFHPVYATVYLPPGDYRVSIRHDAQAHYTGGCPHFTFYTAELPYIPSYEQFVKPGTPINLQAGITYDCEVFVRFVY